MLTLTGSDVCALVAEMNVSALTLNDLNVIAGVTPTKDEADSLLSYVGALPQLR